MSKIIYALLPLVIIGCGQVEPESETESTPAPASQQEALETDRDRIAAPSGDLGAPSAALSDAGAGGNSKFRCAVNEISIAEDLARAKSLVAEQPIAKRGRPVVRTRLPVRPEVIESVPGRAAAAEEPEQD